MADEEKIEIEEEPEVEPEGEELDAIPELEPAPEPEPEETPKFELKGDFPEPPEPLEPKPDEMIEIVHRGQAHRVTKDKAIELAQKGYDYDSKVGPHGKLVKMIETSPEIASLVNEAWQRKVSGLPIALESTKPEPFKAKPYQDYENETEWLQDNLNTVINTIQSLPQSQPAPAPEPVFQPQTPEQPAPVTPVKNTVKEALQVRDPENFHKVFPKIEDYVNQLTISDYQKIDSDMGALCQFYDFVKDSELKKVKPVTSKPGFKVQSGGGEPPRESDVAPAWKLSKADFQKQLDKVKGY